MTDKKIVGSTRLGGKVFAEGDEEALEALGKELGVSTERAYGVDSTEKRNKQSGAQLRSRALARKAERDAAGADMTSEEVDEILSTPVTELEARLEKVGNAKHLQKLSRKDSRVSAKPLYKARIDALGE